ncbi:MAG TPA: YdeI/OmpD-associated family protein, partial [Acidimicrobiales bacterium]|nr:YdeI/OmpD-associated family protein [Acidimicrobiales bacterium]
RLDAANRYAILYRVTTAKRAETRQRRIEQFVAMLAAGETIHPQRPSSRRPAQDEPPPDRRSPPQKARRR